jgi:hypothetical protein
MKKEELVAIINELMSVYVVSPVTLNLTISVTPGQYNKNGVICRSCKVVGQVSETVEHKEDCAWKRLLAKIEEAQQYV